MSDTPLSQQPTMINLQARALDALRTVMADFPHDCTFIVIAVGEDNNRSAVVSNGEQRAMARVLATSAKAMKQAVKQARGAK